MKPVARKGDLHACPRCKSTTPITSVASASKVDGQAVAAVGDKTGCGASIIQGSSVSTTDGKPTAYLGCATDHGGVIITGSDKAKVQP